MDKQIETLATVEYVHQFSLKTAPEDEAEMVRDLLGELIPYQNGINRNDIFEGICSDGSIAS
ncbi:MAG: hypothetical protein ABIH34_02140 [Nanoarchaeota archaeon]